MQSNSAGIAIELPYCSLSVWQPENSSLTIRTTPDRHHSPEVHVGSNPAPGQIGGLLPLCPLSEREVISVPWRLWENAA
jgi:hypothetical protein